MKWIVVHTWRPARALCVMDLFLLSLEAPLLPPFALESTMMIRGDDGAERGTQRALSTKGAHLHKWRSTFFAL